MKIDRKELIALLEKLKPAIAVGGSIVELRHVWFDGEFAYAFEGGLGIRLPFKSEIVGGFQGSMLLGLLNTSSVQEVFLDLSEEGLTVQLGKAKEVLAYLDIKSNPWKEDFQDENPRGVFRPFLELSDEFLAGLKFVRQLKADKPMRSEHYGVILFVEEDFLALYTTDSKMLATVEVEGKFQSALNKVIFPFNFVNQLIALGKKGQKVSVTDNCIMAELGDIRVCSSVLGTENIQDMPAVTTKYVTGKEKFTHIPDLLKEAVSRASILAGAKDNYLRLIVNKKTLTVSGTLQGGILQEPITLASEGTPGEIVIELKQLSMVIRETENFCISKEALILLGKKAGLFVVTAHEEKKGKK